MNFNSFIWTCHELQVGKSMFYYCVHELSWEIPLHNCTCVFQHQFLDHILFQSMQMNTYIGQFDKNNGVKHWASYFRNHSVKKTFVQKLQNNDVPPNQIYTNLVTKASSPLTIIQHCPKVTT